MSDKQDSKNMNQKAACFVGEGIVEWSNAVFFMGCAIHLFNDGKKMDGQKVLLDIAKRGESCICKMFLRLHEEKRKQRKCDHYFWPLMPNDELKEMIDTAQRFRVQFAHRGITTHDFGIREYIVDRKSSEKGTVRDVDIKELEHRAEKIKKAKRYVACFVSNVAKHCGLLHLPGYFTK